MPDPALRYTDAKPTFGAWLIEQRKRDGWLGDFALAAHADRSFPRQGDVEAVKKWLSGKMATGDDWAALDDAENDWICY
ncbi:hypothetical protein [Sphingomonas radiodurans]|uniref:hypothetical protein n=1 Tax=Sphingomonas radiodurans TaxID=2890321 RepID=UPI001E63C87B|nr:hypothetical protein [Sphingomonas radiodurans]WBH17032.1 hypothetical protein LLW23_02620 [Sphingomonas radiodurans]